MNKKYKSLIKDMFVFAVGGIGSKLILFFLVPLYTNFLSTEEYGIADLVFTVAQLIVPIVSIVIFDAVLRFALAKDERKEDVLLSGYIVFGVGACLTICVTPLLRLYPLLSEWKWYLCLYVILTILSNIELNYIKAKEKNALYSTISIIQTLVMALGNVVLLVVLRWGIQGYLLANIAGMVVSGAGIFIFGKLWEDMRVAKFSFPLLKKMIKYSMPLILNNISWWIIHSSDKIMIELMIGASMLGIYTVATKLPSLVNVFIGIFSQAWGVSSTKEIEGEADKKFYSKVLNMYSFVVFSAAICIIAIIKPFMRIYVGVDFLDAWNLVPLLLVSAVFSAISSYFGSMYGALKKPVNVTVTTLIAAGINIIVNFLLIPKMGVLGAVIGTVAAYVMIAFLRMFDILRYIKLKIAWDKLIINSIIILTQAILVSLDIYGYIISVASICVFIAVNFSTIKQMIKKEES